MATPDRNLATNVVLNALEGVVQCIPGEEEEDQIGLRRVAFFASLLKAAPDQLLLWTQNMAAGTPETAAIVAPNIRTGLNPPLAIRTLASEFHHSKNKIGRRLQEIVDLINSDDDLCTELFGIIPHTAPEGKEDDLEVDPEDETETKVDKLLADADCLHECVKIQVNGETQWCWTITHSDGVLTYVPVEHPDVKHLEKLHLAGTSLTLANSFKTKACKRKTAEADFEEPDMDAQTPRTTRKVTLRNLMEKARDDKVRDILPLIEERIALLKRANPGMSTSLVLLRSLGWAKHEIEYRNCFQPSENRQEVAQNAWELLIGPTHYNLDSAKLANVEVHYDRYKNGYAGYNLMPNKDGRVRK